MDGQEIRAARFTIATAYIEDETDETLRVSREPFRDIRIRAVLCVPLNNSVLHAATVSDVFSSYPMLPFTPTSFGDHPVQVKEKKTEKKENNENGKKEKSIARFPRIPQRLSMFLFLALLKDLRHENLCSNLMICIKCVSLIMIIV